MGSLLASRYYPVHILPILTGFSSVWNVISIVPLHSVIGSKKKKKPRNLLAGVFPRLMSFVLASRSDWFIVLLSFVVIG